MAFGLTVVLQYASSIDSPVNRFDPKKLKSRQFIRAHVTYLVFGLVVGLVDMSGDLSLLQPTAAVRQGVTYGVVVTIGVVPVFLLVYGLLGGLAVGTGMSAFGLAFGLAFGDVYVWVRYFLGVRWAAHRGLCPRRPAVFFDWCLDNGLMRQTGLLLEFRHRELLDWFAKRVPDSDPSTASASGHPNYPTNTSAEKSRLSRRSSAQAHGQVTGRWRWWRARAAAASKWPRERVTARCTGWESG